MAKSDFMSSIKPLIPLCNGYTRYVEPMRNALHNLYGYKANTEHPIHSDYSHGLALLIQDFKNGTTTEARKEINTENLDLTQIISGDLKGDFDKLLEQINNRAQIPQQGEFKPINLDDEFGIAIDEFTKKLAVELKIKQTEPEIESDYNTLKGQIDFFFDSLVTMKNSEVLIKEIETYYSNTPEAAQGRKKFIEELATRYPLGKTELGYLVNLIQPNNDLTNMINLLKVMYKEYGLANKKLKISEIVVKYTGCSLLNIITNFIKKDSTGLAGMSLLQYINCEIGIHNEHKVEDLLKDVRVRLNQRISDALILREFNASDENRFAELYTKLNDGRTASLALLREFGTKVSPLIMLLASSTVGLSVINPLLGISAAISIPIIIHNIRGSNEKLNDTRNEIVQLRTQNTQKINETVEAGDEITGNSRPREIERELNSSLNSEDDANYKLKKIRIGLGRRIMRYFYGSSILTTLTGLGLNRFGQISDEQMLTTYFLSSQISNPLINLIGMSSDFFQQMLMVQEMEALLQRGEKISFEEDERKKPFSQLENHGINIKNLSFRTDSGKKIIENISLSIPQGSILTISGESGAGKSTLIKCLLGLYRPSAGEISFGNTRREDLRLYGDDSLKASMATCPQNPVILPGKTLRENLSLYSVQKYSDEDIKKILKALKLEKFIAELDNPISKLSGGERKRIGIARALLKENGQTKILVLDEPTAGLDADNIRQFIQILDELKKGKPELTIICVTHDKALVEHIQNNFDLSDYKQKTKKP
jgi:ABC-type multidrug transport system fused ATPase/permease subunit